MPSAPRNDAPSLRTPQEFLQHFPDRWIQYFDDGPGKDTAKALSTSDFDPREAARKQKQGCGVFFSPNAFDGLRRAGNLKRIQAAFVDLDLSGAGAKPGDLEERLRQGLEALRTFSLPPHVVVRTRNGLQAVWRVEPLPPADGLAQFGEAEELLISRFGADPAAKDVTRVLRLPGFFHLKDPDSPFLCHILLDRLGEPPYRLGDLRNALQPGPAAAGGRVARSVRPHRRPGTGEAGPIGGRP